MFKLQTLFARHNYLTTEEKKAHIKTSSSTGSYYSPYLLNYNRYHEVATMPSILCNRSDIDSFFWIYYAMDSVEAINCLF